MSPTHLINTVWQQELAKLKRASTSFEDNLDDSSSVSDSSDDEDDIGGDQRAVPQLLPAQFQTSDASNEEEEGEYRHSENFLDEAFSGMDEGSAAIHNSDFLALALQESNKEEVTGPSEARENEEFEVVVPVTAVPQDPSEISKGTNDSNFSTLFSDDDDDVPEGDLVVTRAITDAASFALEEAALLGAEKLVIGSVAENAVVIATTQRPESDTRPLEEAAPERTVTDPIVSQNQVEAQKENDATTTNDITAASSTARLRRQQAVNSIKSIPNKKRKRRRDEGEPFSRGESKRREKIGKKICISRVPKRVVNSAIWKYVASPTFSKEKEVYEKSLTKILGQTEWIKTNMSCGTLPFSGYDFARLWDRTLGINPYPGLDVEKSVPLVKNLSPMVSPITHPPPASNSRNRRQTVEVIDFTTSKEVEVIDLTDSPPSSPSPPCAVARSRQQRMVHLTTNPYIQTVPWRPEIEPKNCYPWMNVFSQGIPNLPQGFCIHPAMHRYHALPINMLQDPHSALPQNSPSYHHREFSSPSASPSTSDESAVTPQLWGTISGC